MPARLENFKGLRDLKIPELRRITLPGGQNNVGKSSVPEALFFMAQYGFRTAENVLPWQGMIFTLNLL